MTMETVRIDKDDEGRIWARILPSPRGGGMAGCGPTRDAALLVLGSQFGRLRGIPLVDTEIEIAADIAALTPTEPGVVEEARLRQFVDVMQASGRPFNKVYAGGDRPELLCHDIAAVLATLATHAAQLTEAVTEARETALGEAEARVKQMKADQLGARPFEADGASFDAPGFSRDRAVLDCVIGQIQALRRAGK